MLGCPCLFVCFLEYMCIAIDIHLEMCTCMTVTSHLLLVFSDKLLHLKSIYPYGRFTARFQQAGCDKSPIQVPGAVENSLKFKVLCLNGQLKSKHGSECELKFC